MHLIKLTSLDDEKIHYYINPKSIDGMIGKPDSTKIYAQGESPYIVSEKSDEIISMIRDILSPNEHLYIHEGTKSNQKPSIQKL